MAGTVPSSPARKLSAGRLALALVTALILLFLVAPIVVVFPLSLSSGELLVLPTPGYSLRWYEDFFTSSRWLSATWNSFVVGIATMILATLLGTLAAFGIFLGRFPGKALLLAILSLPMVTPVIVTAIAMYFSLSLVGLGSTLTGLILAHTVLSVPFVLLTVLASLQTFDQNLLRAAASLGANPAIAFRRVVLPLIAPGVATGALFAFATSFDELTIALFASGGLNATLPKQFWDEVTLQVSPAIAAVSTLLFLFIAGLIVLAERLRRRAAAR